MYNIFNGVTFITTPWNVFVTHDARRNRTQSWSASSARTSIKHTSWEGNILYKGSGSIYLLKYHYKFHNPTCSRLHAGFRRVIKTCLWWFLWILHLLYYLQQFIKKQITWLDRRKLMGQFTKDPPATRVFLSSVESYKDWTTNNKRVRLMLEI